jgi:TPR repeat protein
LGIVSLAEMYRNGLGVPPDQKEAARLYREASELGDARACLELGRMYRDGDGVEVSAREARRWLEKAVSLGSRAAATELNGP